MKSLRLLLSTVLLSLSTVAFAQTDAAVPAAKKTEVPPTAAQQLFTKMKSLEGNWEGKISGVPGEPTVEGQISKVSFRVTSMGNVLMHEMRVGSRADDPITMLYLDGDRLTLTHYCDAGNRPRMTAKLLPDGKTVQFDFLDISGNPKYHMHSALFTFIDENHHTEDWTFMVGDKPAHPHFDLYRKN